MQGVCVCVCVCSPTSRLTDLFVLDNTHCAESAINSSGRDKFVPLPATASMLQVAHRLVSEGVHRVAIVVKRSDGEERVQGIVTQTDVLNVVRSNLSALGHVGHAQVKPELALSAHAPPPPPPPPPPLPAPTPSCYLWLALHFPP